MLFDSGAIYSFVSNECVRRLGLVMRELGCELIVTTLVSGEISTSSVTFLVNITWFYIKYIYIYMYMYIYIYTYTYIYI